MIITVRSPISRQLRHALVDAGLEDVLERDHAGDRRVFGDDQGGRPARADLGDDAVEVRRNGAPHGLDVTNDGVGRAFADL